jgi:hypothetical protein
VNTQKNPEKANRPDRARRAVLTGGAVGLAAVAGAAFGGDQPASAQTSEPIWVAPTGDTSGATDTKNINSVLSGTGGGILGLLPGDFYITGVTVPAQTSSGSSGGQGWSILGCKSATTVYIVGNGSTGFYVHRTSNYGAQYGLPAQQTTVFLRDFVVDGSLATGSAVGVDIGDGWGYDLDLVIVNFTTVGSIGLNIVSRLFWTEKGRFRAQLMNNATAAVLSSVTTNGDVSHEYNFYDFNIFCNEDQQGVVAQNSVNNGGCTLWLHGNMTSTMSSSGTPTSNVAALTIGNGSDTDTSAFYASEIVMKVEGNPASGSENTLPYAIYFGNSSNAIQQCHGIITHSLTDSVLHSGEFSFRGLINGDSGLSVAFPGAPGSGQTSTTQPEVPASEAVQQNYGPDMMVYVTGGTVSKINVSSEPTGQTSGGFFIPAGGSITLTYSVVPSWTWVPAARTQY